MATLLRATHHVRRVKWIVAALRTAAAVLATVVALPTEASTISVEIPSLVGEWFVGDSSGPIGFDLGTRFESISEVRVTLTGYAKFTVEKFCLPDGSCGPLQNPTHASIILGTPPNHMSLGVFLAESLGVESVPNQPFQRFDWLFSGVSTIKLEPANPVNFGYGMIERGSVVISRAVVSVTGAPVPEPCTGLLVAAGLAFLSRRTGC